MFMHARTHTHVCFGWWRNYLFSKIKKIIENNLLVYFDFHNLLRCYDLKNDNEVINESFMRIDA